jgi:hypothetical protein
MFLLRSLFRGLTSSILRLAIFAGVLFLCYLLILRPALNEAGDAIDSTKSKPQKLLACAKRSHGDVKRLQRCARNF